MDTTDANQHYITESFVKRRFGKNGSIERYDLKWDSWNTKHSPKFVFAGTGYTQLLVDGEPADNTLEKSFGDIENQLQQIYPVLDAAAKQEKLLVDMDIHKNLCLYCAYLYHLSPFSKANSPALYAMSLDLDLQHGNVQHLQELQMAERDISNMQKLHSQGWKFIVTGDNYLQWTFRVQFVRNANYKAKLFFENTKWTVYNSPIELPISDIALIDYPEANKATLFILPIAPQLVLIGRLEHGTPPPTYTDSVIYGNSLKTESAEDVLDIICFSALRTIVSKNRMDIKAIRERAAKKNIAFTKVMDLESTLLAGKKIFSPRTFRLLPVKKDEYAKFIHSFVQPPDGRGNMRK
jgi:hypothetical protein